VDAKFITRRLVHVLSFRARFFESEHRSRGSPAAARVIATDYGRRVPKDVMAITKSANSVS
jgi:hypothetical protein